MSCPKATARAPDHAILAPLGRLAEPTPMVRSQASLTVSAAGFGAAQARIAHWTAMKPLRKLAALLAGAGLVLGAATACTSGNSSTYQFHGATKLGQLIPVERPQAGGGLQRQPAQRRHVPAQPGRRQGHRHQLLGQLVRAVPGGDPAVRTCQRRLPRQERRLRRHRHEGVGPRRTARVRQEQQDPLPDRVRRARRDRPAPGQHPDPGDAVHDHARQAASGRRGVPGAPGCRRTSSRS